MISRARRENPAPGRGSELPGTSEAAAVGWLLVFPFLLAGFLGVALTAVRGNEATPGRFSGPGRVHHVRILAGMVPLRTPSTRFTASGYSSDWRKRRRRRRDEPYSPSAVKYGKHRDTDRPEGAGAGSRPGSPRASHRLVAPSNPAVGVAPLGGRTGRTPAVHRSSAFSRGPRGSAVIGSRPRRRRPRPRS